MAGQRLTEASYIVLGLLDLNEPATPYESREEEGRRRRFYKLTAQGRKALKQWRGEATDRTYEGRDLAALKLFLGTDPVALAEAQLPVHRQRLREPEANVTYPALPEGIPLVTELGINQERALIRFWSRIVEGIGGDYRSAPSGGGERFWDHDPSRESRRRRRRGFRSQSPSSRSRHSDKALRPRQDSHRRRRVGPVPARSSAPVRHGADRTARTTADRSLLRADEFNAPEKHGNPTGIGHAYLTYPVPTTYLVEAELEKVHHGRYGYRVEVDFPKIANGYGSPISGRLEIDKKWTYKGMRLSVANARCSDRRLQAKIELTFEDGTFLQGSAFKRCTILR